MKTYITLSLLITIPILKNNAQLEISGEIRPRTEYSHGYSTLADIDQKPSLFTAQRTRLKLSYSEDKLKTRLVFQDVRTWGSQKQLVTNEDYAISIHEAWAEVFFIPTLSLKAGRQEVIYDDHRIFGSVGWAHQARSHDMAIFKYENNFKLHLGIGYNQNTNRKNNFYAGPDAYKSLQYIWANKKTGDNGISLLFLNNGKPYVKDTTSTGALAEEGIRFSQTIGVRGIYKLSSYILSGNFYYQTGKNKDGKEISAYEAAIDIGTKLMQNLSINLGYEILSGTSYKDSLTTSKNNSFTPFYGTNHKFNGHMDYFYVGNHANNVGLSNIYLKTNYKLSKSFVAAHIHLFSAAAEISANSDKYLGTEIDLFGGYTLSEHIKIKAGYSQLFGTSAMQEIKGGDYKEINNWGWIMLEVNPVFFKSN